MNLLERKLLVFFKNGNLAVEDIPPSSLHSGGTRGLLPPKGGWPGDPPGGGPGVHFSSASHGLNAVPCQFVLPLEAPKKAPFSGPQSLGCGTHFKLFFLNIIEFKD